MSQSLDALRKTNPRASDAFNDSVTAAVAAVQGRIAASPMHAAPDAKRFRRSRLVPVSAWGAALAVAAAVVSFLALGSSGRGPVESAAAAIRKAVNISAASAEHSGTAVVRITHDRELWAGRTIRWHGADLALTGQDRGRQGRPGAQLLLVGGLMYGIDKRDGGWVELGPPESIDPGSGTTPAQYLAAVREDVGGATLRRITSAMAEPATHRLDDGSTVYSGTVVAGLIARETGFKGGQRIRVLPFGYVAHDEAANPASPVGVAVTVGADGIVRKLTVNWGTGASAWVYTVAYSGLGATPAPIAPVHARRLRELRGG